MKIKNPVSQGMKEKTAILGERNSPAEAEPLILYHYQQKGDDKLPAYKDNKGRWYVKFYADTIVSRKISHDIFIKNTV